MSMPITLMIHEALCPRRWSTKSGRQLGYTVFELMLVLAVMATLALISVPRLAQPLAKSRIKEAAQQVTKLIAETRIQAIKSGEVHQLQFELGGRRLRWGPAAAMVLSDSVPGGFEERGFTVIKEPTGNLASNTPGQQYLPTDVHPPQSTVAERLTTSEAHGNVAVIESDRLARGISFQDPAIQRRPLAPLNTGWGSKNMLSFHPDQRETSQLEALESVHEHLAPIRWSSPICFYPSGLASPTTLVLVSDDGFAVDMRLRRLTGETTIGPILRFVGTQ